MAFGAKQHFHIATEGVRSCNPCILATFGLLGFDVDIIVTPPTRVDKGYAHDQIRWEEYNGQIGDNYIITIKVTHNNRVWKIERLISEPLFDRLSVWAKFLRFEKLRIGVSAVYREIINTIKVFAKRKDM